MKKKFLSHYLIFNGVCMNKTLSIIETDEDIKEQSLDILSNLNSLKTKTRDEYSLNFLNECTESIFNFMKNESIDARVDFEYGMHMCTDIIEVNLTTNSKGNFTIDFITSKEENNGK